MNKETEQRPQLNEAWVMKALDYLQSTDEQYGDLKGRVKALEYRMKVAKAMSFLETEGKGTIAEREAMSLVSDEYRHKIDELENTAVELETISAKRKRAELTIEVWRSQNANRRQGNI